MSFKILNVLSLCNIVCFMTGCTIWAWQRQKLVGRKARNKSVTTVFLEQPLALPRSVNYFCKPMCSHRPAYKWVIELIYQVQDHPPIVPPQVTRARSRTKTTLPRRSCLKFTYSRALIYQVQNHPYSVSRALGNYGTRWLGSYSQI